MLPSYCSIIKTRNAYQELSKDNTNAMMMHADVPAAVLKQKENDNFFNSSIGLKVGVDNNDDDLASTLMNKVSTDGIGNINILIII